MNSKKLNLIKLILFVFFLATAVALFLLLKNANAPSVDIAVPSYIYFIVFGFLVLCGFGIFFINTIAAGFLKEENSIELEEAKDSQKEAEAETVEVVKQTYDLEKLLEKVKPKSKKEFTIVSYTEQLLSNLSKEFDFVQGIMFVKNKKEKIFEYCSDYAFFSENKPTSFKEGETLPGQVVKNKKLVKITEIPENYITIISGLGESSPKQLLIFPILHKNDVIGIIELAAFISVPDELVEAINEIIFKLGEEINKFLKP